ncbi:HK97 family phage prohead protease [Riemerella anatipestifer]|nr:HK97 family phage prohead protease [Riemerella anatipestifer]
MPRFILNDENKQNSYGFKIRTSGISMERFSANPVMLDEHNPSNLSVIGQWKDFKTEDGKLSADTQFDTEDPHAKTIEGKVERGIIKGASMGISFNKKDFSYEDGELILEKCELLEASIVAIPSNANALRLYAEGGELMNDSDVKALCLSVAQNSAEFKPKNMNKIKLSQLAFIALGFAQTTIEASETEINQAILGLQKQKEEAEQKLQLSEEKLSAYIQKEKEQKAQAVTDLVELSIQQGKITADKKQSFIDLATQNFELAKSTLDAIPAKRNFSTGVQSPSGTSAVTNMEEFQKLSLSEQLAFKEANPDGYQAILKTV